MKKQQIVIEIDDGDFWDIRRFGPRFGLTRDDRVIRAVQKGVPLDQHKAVKKLQKKVEQLKQRLNSVQESKTDVFDKISAEIKVQGRKRGLNMADIELVIKIPEKDYHRIAMGFGQEEDAVLLKKIFRNGTPLPEHHGRLIDAKVACPNHTECAMCPVAIECPICATTTIIPATENEFFNFDAPIIKKQTATKEEKKCTDCKWYGFTCEYPFHCTQDTKIAWEPATKEGAE